jgi:hypothetical protein
VKLVGGNFQPDSGWTVTIQTDEGSPSLVATAVETPASSGQYVATWVEQEKFGYWYVDGTKKTDWGKIWLGSVVGDVNYISDFNISGDANVVGKTSTSAFQMPTGAAAGRVLISSDIDGNAEWAASTVVGTYDHSSMNNLAYAVSGHTGFESSANAQFVSGNFATRTNAISASIKQYHNEFQNLAYATSGHTGFESSANAQFVSGNIVTNMLSRADFSNIQRFGFLNQAETTIAFNDTTDVFTLAPTGTSWSYWRLGVKYTITGSKTVDLTPMTTGKHYIYIDDGNGTLEASTTPWSLSSSKVFVAEIIWNSACTPKYWLSDERHTVLIDRGMHSYLHTTVGTKLIEAGTLSGYTENTDTDAAKTPSISEAIVADEDIQHTVAALTDTNGATAPYVVFYRTAATTWAWEYSTMPFKYNTLTNWIQYDVDGSILDVATLIDPVKWVNSYILFTSLTGDAGFVVLPGRATFTSLESAQAESLSSWDYTGFPLDEMVFGYRLTWTTATSTTTGKCQLAAAPVFLAAGEVTVGGNGGTVNHALLSNLAYANSGHTGFESQVNAQFVSGNMVTRVNSVSSSIKQYHNELNNLSYATSGHTGFPGLSAMNDFTTNNHFNADVQVTGSISTSNSMVLYGDTQQVDINRKAISSNVRDFRVGWIPSDSGAEYNSARVVVRAGDTLQGGSLGEVRIEGGDSAEQDEIGGNVILRPGEGSGGSGYTIISGSIMEVVAPARFKSAVDVDGTTTLAITTINGLTRLQANGIVQDNRVVGSNSFVGGFTGSGWKLESEVAGVSRLELDELVVRGTMRVFELLIQQIRATNGSVWVTACAQVSASVYSVGLDRWTMEFVSSNGVGHPFSSGDLLLAQRTNIAGGSVWRSVMQVATVANTGSLSAALVYGTPPSPGMDYVRIGSTSDAARRGSVYLTADEVGAPYMRVIDGVSAYSGGTVGTNFGDLATIKTQVGLLTNITDPDFGTSALTGYGVYTQNGYFKGNIIISPSGSALALRPSQIMLGNITGTANSAIKVTQTGTTSTSGIYGYTSSGAESFALRLNGTSQIAGWSFDSKKLYQDVGASATVAMEVTGSIMQLRTTVSGSDVVRVGYFDNPSETYTSTSVSGLGTWTEDYDQLATFSIDTSTGIITSTTETAPGNGFGIRYSKTLPVTGADDVRGQTLVVTWDTNSRSDAIGDGNTLPYSSVGMIEIDGTSVLEMTTCTPSVIGTFPTWGTVVSKTLRVRVPASATSVKFIFGAYWTNSAPCDLKVDNIAITRYTTPKVEVNQTGIKAYSSPIDRISLNPASESTVAVQDVVATSIRIGNWKLHEVKGYDGTYTPISKLWFAYSSDGGTTFVDKFNIDNFGNHGTT